MCGRITAAFEFNDIRIRWNLDRDLPKYTPRFNIAPERVVPVAVLTSIIPPVGVHVEAAQSAKSPMQNWKSCWKFCAIT